MCVVASDLIGVFWAFAGADKKVCHLFVVTPTKRWIGCTQLRMGGYVDFTFFCDHTQYVSSIPTGSRRCHVSLPPDSKMSPDHFDHSDFMEPRLPRLCGSLWKSVYSYMNVTEHLIWC